MIRFGAGLMALCVAIVGAVGCSQPRLVEAPPAPAPVFDTIQGWGLEGEQHPEYDTASPARMLYHDGYLWILTYGGALQIHKPGTTEWRTIHAPGNDSLMDLHFVGDRLFCVGGGAYRTTFYEFDRGVERFLPIFFPPREGKELGHGWMGTFQGRLVISVDYYDPVLKRSDHGVRWMQDTGWRVLNRIDSGSMAQPYRFLEGDGGLYAGTSLGIMFLAHPDSAWRWFAFKLQPAHSGLSVRVGSFHHFVQWNGNIYSLNTTEKVYVLDPRQNRWVDSLFAKRWYPPDTLDALREGDIGNLRIFLHHERLYVTGAMVYPNGIGSAGVWVWVESDKAFWHLPLYYPTQQRIRGGKGVYDVTDLAFVGDTIYCAASNGVWKYPLSLVP